MSIKTPREHETKIEENVNKASQKIEKEETKSPKRE